MNYQEFAQKIKSKYPQYSDMSDMDLAQKMVAKYPQYSDVTFDNSTPTPEQKPSFLSNLGNSAVNAAEKILPVAGAGIGAGLGVGATAATIGGIPAGAMAGGALGYAGGEALSSWLRRLQGTKPEIKNIPNAVKETGSNILHGAQAELTGQAIAPVVAIAGKVVAPLAKPASKIGQMITGVEAQKINRLAKDPIAILPEALGGSKSISKAGEDLGKAIEKSGLIKQTNPFPESNSVAKSTWDKVQAFMKGQGPDLTPQEVFEGKAAVDEVMARTPWARRNGPAWRDKTLFKNYLRDKLGSFSGELAKASRDYARSALGRDFTSVVPINQGGTPSFARAGLAKILGIPLGINSPLALGTIVSAGSLTNKAINAAAKNPQIRRGFAAIIQNYKNNRSK